MNRAWTSSGSTSAMRWIRAGYPFELFSSSFFRNNISKNCCNRSVLGYSQNIGGSRYECNICNQEVQPGPSRYECNVFRLGPGMSKTLVKMGSRSDCSAQYHKYILNVTVIPGHHFHQRFTRTWLSSKNDALMDKCYIHTWTLPLSFGSWKPTFS